MGVAVAQSTRLNPLPPRKGCCRKCFWEKATDKSKALFQLQLNKEGVQTLSKLGETMRDFKKALNEKTSLRPKIRNVVLGDEASHAQRRRHHHTRYPQYQHDQKHDGQKHEHYTSAVTKARCKCGLPQCSCQRGQRQSWHGPRVWSRKESANVSRRWMKELAQRIASAKPVSGAVAAGRGSKERQ